MSTFTVRTSQSPQTGAQRDFAAVAGTQPTGRKIQRWYDAGAPMSSIGQPAERNAPLFRPPSKGFRAEGPCSLADILAKVNSMMPGSAKVEILEPRWAPARLISGPLPPQFGVDLASISVPLIEAGNEGGAASSDDLSYPARLFGGLEYGLKAQVSFISSGGIVASLVERTDLSIDRGATSVLPLEARAFLDLPQFAARLAGMRNSTLLVDDPVLESSSATSPELHEAWSLM